MNLKWPYKTLVPMLITVCLIAPFLPGVDGEWVAMGIALLIVMYWVIQYLFFPEL